MDDAMLAIKLQWEEEGREVFERNKLALAEMNANLLFRDALRTTGLIGQEAEIRSTKSETDAFKDATDAVKDQTQALERNALQTGWNATFGAALTAQELAYAKAQSASTAATSGFSPVAALAGAGVWGVVAAVTAGVIALWPFVMLVGSAAVALVSFAVAGAGFVALGAAVAGVFAAIGAGVLLLGGGGGIGSAAALGTATTHLYDAQQALKDFNQLHTGALTLSQTQQKEDLTLKQSRAQQTYTDALTASQGPTGVLIAQLTVMKNTLADQAAPLAAMITLWVGGAIPAITQLGQSVMTWFGDRLPGVLSGVSKIIKDLSPDFQAFGVYFGGVMDKIGPLLGPVTEAFARLGLEGAKGLLDNLVRLAEWFVANRDKLGKIVSEVFGALGDAIQYIAKHWGELTDLVEKKWPTTVKNAQEALKELHHWWDVNGQTVQTFMGHVVDLMGQFNNFIGVAVKLSDVFKTVWDFLAGLGGPLGGPPALLKDLQDVAGTLATIWGYAQNLGMGGSSGAQTTQYPGASANFSTASHARPNNSTQNNYMTFNNIPTTQAGARAFARALGSV
jgi:hypothetical protein